MPEIHQKLQRYRKSAKLSQAQLADLAQLTQAMISKFESGKDVRLSTLLAITSALGLTLEPLTQSQVYTNKIDENKGKSIFEQVKVPDDE